MSESVSVSVGVSAYIPNSKRTTTLGQVDYTGMMFAEKHDHRKGEYLCMDDALVTWGSSSDSNGALLYPVEAQVRMPCVCSGDLEWKQLCKEQHLSPHVVSLSI